MSDSDKNNNATDDEVGPLQTEAEQEKWLGLRRERLARERRRNLIIVTSVAVVALLLLVFLIWKWRSSSTKEEPTAVVVSVKVAKVEKETIAAPVSAIGTIFPREQATVAAKISAQIKTMALLKNKLVKAGEVIAVLESRDLVAQRNEAVAALNQERANERSVNTGTIPQTNAQDQKALRDAQAKVATTSATYARRQVLFQKGGISKKDLESSQMDLRKRITTCRADGGAAHEVNQSERSRACVRARASGAATRCDA